MRYGIRRMTTGSRFTAVALAGGSLESDFRSAGYTVANKAYLPVGKTTMLERVLRALRGSTAVGRIRCVTQPEAFEAAFGSDRSLCDDVVSPGRDLIDSLLAGFDGLAPSQMVLVAATDIPLVTSSALDAFCARAAAIECDLGYGCIRREAHAAEYPSIRHTWVRLREGTFCGGGVSVLRSGAIPRIVDLLARVIAARKSPLKLAVLFSPLLIIRLLFGQVSITELEARATRMSGLACRGILCNSARFLYCPRGASPALKSASKRRWLSDLRRSDS